MRYRAPATTVSAPTLRLFAASVAIPNGGKSEYLMGRKIGLLAPVTAGTIGFTLIAFFLRSHRSQRYDKLKRQNARPTEMTFSRT